MAKKTASKVEPGDRLLVELPVVATWPDMGKITVTIRGNAVHFRRGQPRDPRRAEESEGARRARAGQDRQLGVREGVR